VKRKGEIIILLINTHTHTHTHTNTKKIAKITKLNKKTVFPNKTQNKKMSGYLGGLSKEQEDCLNDLKERLSQLDDVQKAQLELRNQTSTYKIEEIDVTLLRFLRSRDFNTDVAFKMFCDCLTWRSTFFTRGVESITIDLVLNEAKVGKAFYHGYDKESRPVCYVQCKLHDSYTSSVDEVQMNCVYMMELGRKLLKLPMETCTVVFDMDSLGLKNLDLKFTTFFISMLEKNYPESLGYALVLNAPWVFWGSWPLIKSLIPPPTQHKIKFLNNDGLLEYIPQDQLLKQYGGTTEKHPELTTPHFPPSKA